MPKRKSKAQSQSAQLAIPEAEFFAPLDALHRGENSQIGFLRKNGESKTGIENLFALTKEEVRAMLPEIAKWLLQDAYFTVNGYNSKAPYNARETGLPSVWRKEKNLRYLNAVYADLDVGRAGETGAPGLSVPAASQLLIDLLTGGTLPQLSMSAQSGRGLYAFWILRDDDDENAPETFKGLANFWESLRLYKQVNRAICERLKCLAADKICDAARILRVPGTLHSTSGEKCFYKVTFDGNGKLVTYTLRELAKAFGVPVLGKSLPRDLRPQWRPGERELSANPNPKKANGPKALAAARARDLVALEQWRGGWTKPNGCFGRRWHLRLYAQFLKAAGTGKSEVLAALETMAANCQPPYPSDPNDVSAKVILNEVWLEPFAQLTQLNLVKWLQISPDEARELELEKLVPIEVQDERQLPKGGNRAQEKETRRAQIQALIHESGMLSARDFAAALKLRGIEASSPTIARDLIDMGHQKDAARKKAGRKPSDQMSFPTE